jgi:hypothetical protein
MQNLTSWRTPELCFNRCRGETESSGGDDSEFMETEVVETVIGYITKPFRPHPRPFPFNGKGKSD